MASHNDKTSVVDSDAHFIIDLITRKVISNTDKSDLVQFDHNSERITFECPRYIEGHDMLNCNRVIVNYLDNDLPGVYEVDDLTMKDTNTVMFSWLISSNATQKTGKIFFAITFMCVQTNGDVTYRWNTAINEGLKVIEGMNQNSTIVYDNVDILEQWKQQLFGTSDGEISKIQEATNECLKQIPSDYSDLNAKVDTNTTSISELKESIKNVNVTTDITLEQSGKPADSKVVGDKFIEVGQNIDELQERIEASSNSGISDSTKEALLNCFRNVAWVNATGQQCYESLQKALNSSATLTGISATYNGGQVPANINLDSLKENLVVKATYEDGQEIEITNYKLSGNLSVGENTITVTYRKFTTTFVAIGVESYSITYNLTNVQCSNMVSSVIKNSSFSTKLLLEENYSISNLTVVMGNNDVTQNAYSDGSISITEVTGDVIITVTASIPEQLELYSAAAGTNISYYSDDNQAELISSQNYGTYAQTKKITHVDTPVRIVLKNNTDSDVKLGDIYAGSRKAYDPPKDIYISVVRAEKIKTNITIGAGKSITFEYTVKSGCRLCFSHNSSIDYTVYGTFTDKDFGTELSTTTVSTTTYKAYSDDGATLLKQGYYYTGNATVDDLTNTEVFIVINPTEEVSIDGIIIGSYTQDKDTIIKNAVQTWDGTAKIQPGMPFISKKVAIKDGCKAIFNGNTNYVKMYKA